MAKKLISSIILSAYNVNVYLSKIQ